MVWRLGLTGTPSEAVAVEGLAPSTVSCSRCGADLSWRKNPGPLCGICDITLSRRAPGLVGQDYRNEENPEKYQPAKEQYLAIKRMQDHPDPKQRIDQKTAARWKKLFVERAQIQEAQAARIPEKVVREHNAFNAEMQRLQITEQQEKVKKAEDKLRAIDAHMKVTDRHID